MLEQEFDAAVLLSSHTHSTAVGVSLKRFLSDVVSEFNHNEEYVFFFFEDVSGLPEHMDLITIPTLSPPNAQWSNLNNLLKEEEDDSIKKVVNVGSLQWNGPRTVVNKLMLYLLVMLRPIGRVPKWSNQIILQVN
jgi:hypothetical protein